MRPDEVYEEPVAMLRQAAPVMNPVGSWWREEKLHALRWNQEQSPHVVESETRSHLQAVVGIVMIERARR